ncbi:hypothetical protein ZWY2020_003963 [Hordeum vulgare]|nr:hypothetical protein ZWY2020_003963 [Hordeum vulgare]
MASSPLAHVLCLLSAQEVVRMCLLVRCWRDDWRSVPTLRFTWAKGSGSADRFARFVDACSTSGAGVTTRLWRPAFFTSIPMDSCCCPQRCGMRASGSGRPCLVSGCSGFVSSRSTGLTTI